MTIPAAPQETPSDVEEFLRVARTFSDEHYINSLVAEVRLANHKLTALQSRVTELEREGYVWVEREQHMGCIAPLKVGDKVRVKYKDGSGYLNGNITKIWESPHAQAQVNNGWCFHARDEVVTHEPLPAAPEREG